VEEGNLKIITSSTGVKDKYSVSLILNYTDLGLNISYNGPEKIRGEAKLSLLNGGEDPIKIIISQL